MNPGALKRIESQTSVRSGRGRGLGAALAAAVCWSCAAPSDNPQSPSAAVRAVSFLAREVPLWRKENGCFSCHNNGDGARALYRAKAKGHGGLAGALAGTTVWLGNPGDWDNNRGDPGFSDRRLADLQFAIALAAASEAGEPVRGVAMAEARRRVISGQAADGSWPIGEMDVLGSPATYGTALATAIAMRWLGGSDDAGARGAVSRAEGWWADRKPRNLVEASAWLWAWPGDPPATARAGWEVSWAMIEQGQGKGGGWGPYADAPPEPFDTALALLVLMESARHGATVKVEVLARGRRYLMETQREDGSWEETTRPARGRSYAQRMSTTAWAALALLELE